MTVWSRVPPAESYVHPGGRCQLALWIPIRNTDICRPRTGTDADCCPLTLSLFLMLPLPLTLSLFLPLIVDH